MFVAQQIENSNLLLLVTEAYCDCSIFPPVLLEPTEVKYILCRTLTKYRDKRNGEGSWRMGIMVMAVGGKGVGSGR